MCHEEVYLKGLVRYIHLNPIRASILFDLAGLRWYRYCGHGVLTGDLEMEWRETEYVLAFFGKKIRPARKSYLFYMD